MRVLLIFACVVFASSAHAQGSFHAGAHELRESTRIYSSDASASERFAAALNLGDLHAASGEAEMARIWWRRADTIATEEMNRLREAGRLGAWARFAAWKATASAAMGDRTASIELFEEARRILPGSVDILAQYAATELSSGDPSRAEELAQAALSHTSDDPLDRAALQYTLARAQIASGAPDEGRSTLEQMIITLESDQAASTRKEVERAEEFTTFGLSSGDAQAWTSLMTRGRTLLAQLLLSSGSSDEALVHARAALDVRSDYAPALAIIGNHERHPATWALAFASNPFDRTLHRSYAEFLALGGSVQQPIDSPVQRVIALTHERRWSSAASLLSSISSAHPKNESLLALEADLLLAQGRTSEARSIIDSITSESIRASIRRPSREQPSTQLPEAGALLRDGDLSAIVDRLSDPSTAVDATAALDGRMYTAAATLTAAELDGNTTKASGAVTSGGTLLRFPSTVRFVGNFTEEEIVLEFSVLAADAEGLVVEPAGARRR